VNIQGIPSFKAFFTLDRLNSRLHWNLVLNSRLHENISRFLPAKIALSSSVRVRAYVGIYSASLFLEFRSLPLEEGPAEKRLEVHPPAED